MFVTGHFTSFVNQALNKMKINNPGIFASTSKILALHFILFTPFFLFIYFVANYTLEGISDHLSIWDSKWYQSIAFEGYQYKDGQNNTAFFPLFPYFWKYTGLDVLGISIANFLIFVLSFYLFVYFFKPKEKTQQLYLAIPCLLFFMVPYSESLFFLFAVLILGGMKTKNWWLTIFGFFMATLTRSAGTIFIPALIGSVVLLYDKSTIKKTVTEYTLYITASIAATAVVIYMHFHQTGVWFAAAKTQKYWDHSLRLPALPMVSWSNSEILRLDGTALLIGLTALMILIGLLINKLKKTYPETENYYIFALLYLGGISLSILLFQGGDLHSLNRYIYATPFYFIFLLTFEKKQFTLRQLGIAFAIFLLFFLLLGSYKTFRFFIEFLALSILLLLFLLTYASSEKIARWAFIIIYILATFYQAYLFVKYLKAGWIG